MIQITMLWGFRGALIIVALCTAQASAGQLLSNETIFKSHESPPVNNAVTRNTIAATDFIATSPRSNFGAPNSNNQQGGAITRTPLTQKNPSMVKIWQYIIVVQDFGAVGDGEHNDYSAIVNAQLAAYKLGKCVFFPSGIYSYHAALSFTDNNLCWIGEPGTILRYDGGRAKHALLINGSTLPNGIKFRLENIRINGNGLADNGLTILKGVAFKVENISVTNVKGAGFLCRHCVLGEFYSPAVSSNIERFSSVPSIGMYLDEASYDNVILSPRMEGIIRQEPGRKPGTGIKLGEAVSNTFIAGTSEGNQIGIELEAKASHNHFVSTFLEGNTTRDLICRGFLNVFDNLIANETGAQIWPPAYLNTFRGGDWKSIVLEENRVQDLPPARHNVFHRVLVQTNVVDNGKNTVFDKVWDNSPGVYVPDKMPGIPFAYLGEAIDGTWAYCSNCKVATPHMRCTPEGKGAWAFSKAGQWRCPF